MTYWFFWKNLHRWIFTNTENIKLIMRASSSWFLVTLTVTPSYETALWPPYPLDPGDPQTLDFYKNLITIRLFGHVVMLRKFISPFHSLGWSIKSVKLTAIYIQVRAEGWRTTPATILEQDLFIQKTCHQDCFHWMFCTHRWWGPKNLVQTALLPLTPLAPSHTPCTPCTPHFPLHPWYPRQECKTWVQSMHVRGTRQ